MPCYGSYIHFNPINLDIKSGQLITTLFLAFIKQQCAIPIFVKLSLTFALKI